MQKSYQQGLTNAPSAHIAVNRNRLKHYGDIVYLKGKTHFEIELFNPKSHKILAKIKLNGKRISEAGIVLFPGQRVFLERWLDTSNKFLFETYQVEDSEEAKKAIELNGKVEVDFYDEVILISNNYTPFTLTVPWNQPSLFIGTTNSTALYSSNVGSSLTTSNNIETGIASFGENSNQSFTNDYSNYSQFCSTSIKLTILPESKKPVEISNIRNYCSSCGTRIKNSNWKFCPKCGTQL
jgi:hypothetical protein